MGNMPGRMRAMSEKNRRTPNNVRQIGQVPPHQKIYIEDYVMTFLKHMALEPDSTGVGVLLGEMRQNGSMTVLYVSGVVRMPESLPAEGTTFSGESWEKVYEDIKKSFKDVEILGWVVGQADLEGKLSEKIVKIHRKQFAGKNKLLLLYDYIEKEETIFLSDGNHLKKQSGYFVYYEKNEEMKIRRHKLFSCPQAPSKGQGIHAHLHSGTLILPHLYNSLKITAVYKIGSPYLTV